MVRIGRGAAAAMLAGALTAGVAVMVPAGMAYATSGSGGTQWSPALSGGDAVGVQVTGGVARLAPDRVGSADAALPSDGHGDTRSLGLLTLPARRLTAPVDRVDATIDLAARDATSGVSVDIRGLRPGGTWTEWLPGKPVSGARSGEVRAVLPTPVTQVQARLVLNPVRTPGRPGARSPEVQGLTLTAHPAPPFGRAQAAQAPASYRVFATREGLVGGTTANGHVIADRDLFVALPSRRALSPHDTSDYSVKVCAPSGRCAFAPVWDVGPWNTRDDYWNPSDRRETWQDLPQGVPESQAAKTQGYNGGKDGFGRVVRNPAGIDLADGLFWDALGLTDNAWVTVDYLWTGDSPLATVRVDRRVDLRGAPDPRARVVGLVADRAAVPVECFARGWLRIGAGQFLPAGSVPRGQWPRSLPTCGDR
jgi:hypothetical protein